MTTKKNTRKNVTAVAGLLLVALAGAALYGQAPAGAPQPPSPCAPAPRIGFPGSPTADCSRAVADGGIKVAGWSGQVDATEEAAGMFVKDAELAQDGDGLRVKTGPAVEYWRPGDKMAGDYTVSATFNEPKYMNLNTHPHPYGVFIGGNDMGTPNQTFLYCGATGNGTFIVRGFGPAPFRMNGDRATKNDAIHKAGAKGAPVTQDIALSVKGNQVLCQINGTVVATYEKQVLVTTGKLKSTDGTGGLRFAHNTEVKVTGFKMAKD
jgi:hypothetical protein